MIFHEITHHEICPFSSSFFLDDRLWFTSPCSLHQTKPAASTRMFVYSTSLALICGIATLIWLPPSHYTFGVSAVQLAFFCVVALIVLACLTTLWILLAPFVSLAFYALLYYPTADRLEEKFNTRTAIAALGPRMVHLARCFNMRDLGTLKTADKRHYIRPNVLFRSDRLSRLYQADVDAIDERTGGVGLVLDFRTEYERSVAPDQLSKVKPPRYVALPVGEGVKLPIPHEKYVSYLLQGLFPPADEIGDVMSAFCLALLDANPHMWARMFDEIFANDGKPLIFHCMAGKDRTGIAALFILLALGVSREDIIEDYMVCTPCNAPLYEWYSFWLTLGSRGWTSTAQLHSFMYSRRETIENIFERVDKHYGTVENCLLKCCGLTPEKIQQLKAMYLLEIK